MIKKLKLNKFFSINSVFKERMLMIIGKKAPLFTAKAVIDNKIQEISFDDYKDRYKVVFFYPLDFTHVCPTELRSFQQELEEFKKKNTIVIGISVDSVYSHLAWLSMPEEKGGIKGIEYPLVSDLTKSISRSYGVLNEEKGVAYRGVFIIDRNNIVQSICINNLSIGRNIKEVLRLTEALQFTQSQGEMCPANWQAGQEGIKS